MCHCSEPNLWNMAPHTTQSFGFLLLAFIQFWGGIINISIIFQFESHTDTDRSYCLSDVLSIAERPV